MQFYDISFMRPYKQSDRWQDVLDTKHSIQHLWMRDSSTITLHAQVFLRMNTGMFEIFQRHYN
jgi:hypothetical protein